ncbi:hypothetical protein [Acinetobacter sp. A2]|uniref:hypothetical protein n=1 Tax=Acinetobacter sp. A2 TaxID=362457 RepID=UPI003AF35E46
MPVFIVISIIFIILLFIFYFKKPERLEGNYKDFQKIILYTSDFLEKNPKEMTILLNDVTYSELLNFIEGNPSRISQFEQIDKIAISFAILIDNSEYKVYASKFVADKLIIAAKKSKK